MNVQSAKLLSGSEMVGNQQQGSSAAVDTQGGFASALMRQLTLLNGDGTVANSNLAALQNWVDAAKTGSATPANLQQFAALLGKELPGAAKNDRDIDLEETLKTLTEVLQQLQQLEAGTETASMLQTANGDGSGSDALLNPTDSSSETDDSAQVVADPSVDVSVVAEPVAPAAALPVNATAVDADEANLPVDGDSEQFDLPKGNGKYGSTFKPEAPSLSAGIIDSNLDLSDSGLDFNRSIRAMLGGDGANAGGQQDKPSSGLTAESLVESIETLTEEGDGGKSLPSVAADVAKLNQAVRGSGAGAEQSAMSKNIADPAWNKELGEKLIWMHKQAIPSAELRLNPEHLGPVLVKIDVNQDQASVVFTAQHLAVKEAIEAAIPKLREMLNGQQLNLADVNVSQQQSDQRQTARDFFQMASGQGGNASTELSSEETLNDTQNLVDEIEAGRAVATNGLLSLFA